MRPRELDSFREPSRRPWLLLGLAVAAAAAVYWLRARPERAPEVAQTPASTTAEPTGSARPRPIPNAGESGAVGNGGPAIPPAAAPSPAVKPATAPSSAAATSQNAARLLEMGRAHETAGRLLEARQSYLAALAAGAAGAAGKDALEVERRLGEINVKLISGPYAMPEKVRHEVQRGESLDLIASRYGTTSDLIQKSNGIEDPNRIRIGQRLLVLKGRFDLTVSRARNDMLVTLDGAFFKRYRIGSGKEGKTPVGTFEIVDKEKNPTWWPEGREVPFGHPDNILGTRWMSIRATGGTPAARGYGIHGTWDDASIGKSESAGCVRMRNADVEELFTYVTRGTPVVIKD